ncbi:MAG: hypothetical protein IJV28_03770 [Paludibacteraceae bacterium]|nr:hypothetical protein [Paludibacteraceae bacterium]
MSDYTYKGSRHYQTISAKAFARSYEELKDELRYLDGSPGSPNLDGMPHGFTTGDRTASAAMKRYDIRQSIDLIEQTAKDVSDPGLYPYLLEAVTHGTSFKRLQERRIPCSVNTLTAYKKKFYAELWNRLQRRR